MASAPIRIKFAIEDEGTKFLAKVSSAVKGPARRDFVGYVSRSIAEVAREHVRTIAPQRHGTASKLGARPTNHLIKAADSIQGQWDDNNAFLTFPRTTGLSRAWRPFNLKPVKPGIKFLTMPAQARTYGRRAGEFNDLEFAMVLDSYNGHIFARPALVFPDGTTAFFLLRKAHLPQDRGLMPSDAEFARGAEIGARDYLKAITTP